MFSLSCDGGVVAHLSTILQYPFKFQINEYLYSMQADTSIRQIGYGPLPAVGTANVSLFRSDNGPNVVVGCRDLASVRLEGYTVTRNPEGPLCFVRAQ